MTFFKFMATRTGRIVRVVAGLALIAIGLLVIEGTAGVIVALVGLVPFLAGATDRCVFAPLAKLPFDGRRLRDRLGMRADS